MGCDVQRGREQWRALDINDASEQVLVVQTPNLVITKTGDGTINSTDTATFTITVSNTGAGTAYGVNVSDLLPDAAQLSWTTSAGTISSGTLTDAIGNLAPDRRPSCARARRRDRRSVPLRVAPAARLVDGDTQVRCVPCPVARLTHWIYGRATVASLLHTGH